MKKQLLVAMVLLGNLFANFSQALEVRAVNSHVGVQCKLKEAASKKALMIREIEEERQERVVRNKAGARIGS